MPAYVTATFPGQVLRYDNVPIVNGTWSIDVDTKQLANSTSASPTPMEVVPTDAAGNIGAKAVRRFVINNVTSALGIPAMVPDNWRVRSNSTRVADGDGLRITAVNGAANSDVDNNIATKLIHVTAGEFYDFSAIMSTPAATGGNRIGQIAVEWLAMGAGEDGYGGVIVPSHNGESTQRTGTLTPGASVTLSLLGLTAPATAARARIILRLQYNASTSPIAAGDSVLVRQVKLIRPGADTTAPTAAFSSPEEGATLSETQTVSGSYDDEVA